MNIVLADQAEDASDTESTNGLGKTTLIRIIHYCLGSDLSRDKVLSHPDLRDVEFLMRFAYGDQEIEVRRSTADKGEKVIASASFFEGVGTEPIEKNGAAWTVSLADWTAALTRRFLTRKRLEDGSVDLLSPTFRELSYYYMRVGKAAFTDPRQVFQGQSGRQKQVSISYMLGLNWQVQRQLLDCIDKRSSITKAINVIKDAEDIGAETIGDMEAQRVVLEQELERKQVEAENFNVRDDYADLEKSLYDTDTRLHDLINENHSDNQLLRHYVESAQETPEADPNRPLEILRNAGAVFQESALRTIKDVSEFHGQVYRNRKAFLDGEISRLKSEVRDRTAEIRGLTSRKSEILQLLNKSGALETLIQLQAGQTELTAELEALKGRIEERKKFDRRKDEQTRNISDLRTLLKSDLEDRQQAVDEARALFARYTKHLYGTAAKLAIDVATNGYRFHITIEREGSDGVEQMVVFCFDLMIATLRAKRGSPFKTLIHDSSLFADVDPRQYGLALQLAREEAENEGFQYICCLNSGALPHNHLGSMQIDDYTKLRLTDDSEKSRLLGVRLSARESG
ncbi:DUF2326 domain-containing protein [Roseinatronobacter bogoriensis]|uniref:DUF2326 domain-containing protein n=1 Tax=Roseinatronobacter bogoriensis subsp. barguzinensis TaxID=441209 RepID=A0A2K8KFD2_9RHOB|nr:MULTISPECIES: DUF2326 domain-containing protein [Rhodobaca]ATX65498.1 DUF2326 domain-containing protein [Rhodobaca barguzinensis]